MNTIREQDWPAHEPPLDFAVRAVDAMLAPAKPVAGVHQLRHPRKVLLFWVLAALFASGTALAWTWSRYHRTPAVVARTIATHTMPITVQSRSARRAISIAAVVPPATASAPTPKAHSVRAVSKAPPKTTQPPPQPRTPACQCERGFSDFMCDCY